MLSAGSSVLSNGPSADEAAKAMGADRGLQVRVPHGRHRGTQLPEDTEPVMSRYKHCTHTRLGVDLEAADTTTRERRHTTLGFPRRSAGV